MSDEINQQIECDHDWSGPEVEVDHWMFVTSVSCAKCGVAALYLDERWV